jgi:hypothetical protein
MVRSFAFLLLATFAFGQGGALTSSEARTLLAVGVAEAEITAVGVRLGGFATATLDELDLLVTAGATPILVERFPVAEDPLKTLKALAERSETWKTPRNDVLLVPKGWRSVDIPVGEGACAYRIAPPSATDARAGVDPVLFVFIQEKSAIPAEGVAAVAERLEGVFARRLTASECPTRSVPTGTLHWRGREVPLRRVETTTPKGTGTLAVAFDLLPDGRAIGLGYSAPESLRVACERHLEDLARSFAPVKTR